MIEIRCASLPADLPTVHALFREYGDGLGIDLGFQHFEQELAQLPGQYAAPRGCVLLAWNGARAVGCIALRPVAAEVCEMKRLYVRSEARGQQLGRRLAEQLLDAARDLGYRRMWLDTLPSMASAIALYRDLGFEPIAPYVYNPIEGALFFGRDL
jgi:ribosomal protein S18 acetylase RimI-like enzyme